ncbi:MAG: ATP-binding protein [Candidatus Margulisbacteria bacterium]|jgi:predicted AAA+ superfamily ATPase|nr:ATP-binding protein [Candidatus Margulisiibacteriota bacterium]
MPTDTQLKIKPDALAAVLKEQYEAFTQRDSGMPREILADLADSVAAPQVLVITGLRRVGKSTLLAQIAARYLKDNFYFVSFEDERLLNFQVTDFDLLQETLISIFGERKTFLFDEIQNVPEWERFVRRLHDQGYKFIITGSNASLLSEELGTRLTGRSLRIELFPFSFREFLLFQNVKIPDSRPLTTRQRGLLRRQFDLYARSGGIPDALKFPELDIHKTMYSDVLYRDIAARYKLANARSLQELSFFLLANAANLVSFNKLKNLLRLGSVNTVKNYIAYLENSWLFFTVHKYAASIKEQQIAPKKVYSIDSGLARSVGFAFSENRGRMLENIVFLHLRRRQREIFYYKTAENYEVDFWLPADKILLQTASGVFQTQTREREVRALISAAQSLKRARKYILITENLNSVIRQSGLSIQVKPAYEWLLFD